MPIGPVRCDPSAIDSPQLAEPRRRAPWRAGLLALSIATGLVACSEGSEPAQAPPPLPKEVTAPLREDVAAPAPLAGEPAAAEAGAAELNAPPADLRREGERVRCLIDSPPGCDGCDRGDTCVYEELSAYDCVYVVYGTSCSE